MIDKSKLKELALAATPGPWAAKSVSGAGLEIHMAHPQYPDKDWPAFGTKAAWCEKGLVAYETWVQFPNEVRDAAQARNAAFIAAANPAAILELLAELESARNAALEEAAKAIDALGDANFEGEKLEAAIECVSAIRSLATTASTSAPAPSAKQEPNALIAAIGKLIATQDNRYTDQPMFIVQQRRRLYGLDSGYCENIIWLCSEDEYSEASEEEAAILEKEYQKTGIVKSGWTRTGYIDQREFVTACFTEQGCKDYLARDGHNLKEPRIYAEGSYRNEEFRAIRNWLLSLAAPSASASPAAPAGWREFLEEMTQSGKEMNGSYWIPRAVALLAAAPAVPVPVEPQPVPEGYAIVPLEPTPEMVNAPNTIIQAYGAKLIYQRMVAAAPSLQQGMEGAGDE